jgi:hypothetical protein
MKKLNNIKSRTSFIKENYFSGLGDKLQNAKDDVVRDINQNIADKATGRIAKGVAKTAAKMGAFPKEEMEKFISYIQSNCSGEVVTLERIKELVAPMLRFGVGLSADRARTTAIPTENIDFVALVSELVYDEMSERGILDCTDSEFEDDGYDDVEDFEDEESFDDEDFEDEV